VCVNGLSVSDAFGAIGIENGFENKLPRVKTWKKNQHIPHVNVARACV